LLPAIVLASKLDLDDDLVTARQENGFSEVMLGKTIGKVLKGFYHPSTLL